ncbi:hypothetical protein D3C76_1718810 [compost metagenome]
MFTSDCRSSVSEPTFMASRSCPLRTRYTLPLAPSPSPRSTVYSILFHLPVIRFPKGKTGLDDILT